MRSFAFLVTAFAVLLGIGLGSGVTVTGCAARGPSRSEGPPALDVADTRTTLGLLEVSTLREDAADWNGALARVDKALALQPNSRTALLRSAQLALIAEHAGGAAADREQVREILARAGGENDAERLLVEAWLAAVEGRADAALAAAQRAADAAPDSARAQWLAARLLALHGDAPESLAAAERAVQLDATSGAARRERARALLRSGDFENALGTIGPQLRAHPNDAEARAIEAEARWRMAAFASARRGYESIAPARRDPGVQTAIGWLALRMGDREAPHAAHAAGLAAHPTDARLLDAMMALDESGKRIGDSIARLEAAAAATPNDAVLARLRGRALAAAHRDDDAAAAFGRALALAPGDGATYDAIAAWLARARPESVEPRLARLGASGAAAYMALGSVRAARGDRAGAIEALRKAVEADSSLPLARAMLARALAAAGQSLDQAVSLAREARAAQPNDPYVAWALGVAHLARGQNDSAFEALRAAAGSFPVEHPSYGEILFTAAQALDHSGEREFARRAAAIAVEHAGDAEPAPAWKASAKSLVARLQPPAPERPKSPDAPPATSEAMPPASSNAASSTAANASDASAAESAPNPATRTTATQADAPARAAPTTP